MRLPITALITLLTLATPIVAMGQTAPRADRRVIALRVVTLKPNVRAADFERFFADSLATPVNSHFPGVRMYLLKGERGARVGGYVSVLEFESLERRNEYFPTPDSTSARYDQLAKAYLGNAVDNLSRYVEIVDPTDYVVVK